MSNVKEFFSKTFKIIRHKISAFLNTESGESAASSVMSILSGILVGFIFMLIFSPGDSVMGLITILFGGMRNVGQFLWYATPLLVTGLSVGFAFKTGLFNIGATGQFTVGGIAATYIGIHWTFLPGATHWIVAIIGAIIAGSLWGYLPGLLKAKFNVHEVVSTIMMNYMALYLTIFFVSDLNLIGKLNSHEAASVATSAVIPKMLLDKIFPNSSITGGFWIALIAVAIIYVVLNKTTFGYELKAVGYNKESAKYAGINEKRSIIFSMMIAGALSGLAGAIVFLTQSGDHLLAFATLRTEGFDGIAVALIGFSNPIGVLFAALFIGYIKFSGFFLQTYNYTTNMIQMIIGIIVYFSAISVLFKPIFNKLMLKHKERSGGEK